MITLWSATRTLKRASRWNASCGTAPRGTFRQARRAGFVDRANEVSEQEPEDAASVPNALHTRDCVAEENPAPDPNPTHHQPNVTISELT